ncbi:MAG TPA: hypothetical protein VNJ08_04205 [Bacteriovoracaceae bacterium]|nr:hypothetical protein [Bacteriovoracaceae bacterium]
MKKLFLLLFIAFSSYAQEDFCSRGKDTIRTNLENPSSRIAFKNNGGFFDGGVCWWHSRLQRASAFLVRFEPSAPIPTQSKVSKILSRLKSMKEVVTIPGYSDFESFTRANHKAVQATLNAWQRMDGFINQQWIRSISGRSSMQAEKMKAKIDEIYQAYQDSPVPVWLMAQIKGISAHSFLLLEMNQVANGYQLKVIDSNRPDVVSDITYTYGDQNLHVIGSNYTFVLYVGFQADFQKMARALKAHCPNLDLEMESVPRGDLEL